MTKPPPAPAVVLNQLKSGYYGELGAGENARVKFLQTAVTPEELDKITLIQNIPGSHAWDVRDLFQRDVDTERVTRDILPYLQDPNRVKYFNPLTLVLLPLVENQDRVLPDLAPPLEEKISEEGASYRTFQAPGLFAFDEYDGEPAYSRVRWNDRRVRLVAIDGQHRLSALKRWKDQPQGVGELSGWHIPVVILGIFRDDPAESSASVLEIVRKTFIYINSRAEQVNRARAILLDDESIVNMCVQEMVQESHRNDNRLVTQRDPSKLPLLFFDWRGDTRDGAPVRAPAAIVSTVELKEWFDEYLLGPDGDEKQVARLQIRDMIPPLGARDLSQVVSHSDAKRIRHQFRVTMYPGLSYLLENFRPFEEYNREVKKLEHDALRGSDLAKHAFQKLRFGTFAADDSIISDVQGKYQELVDELTDLRARFIPPLVARDVGMRAIISAFDILKEHRDHRGDATMPWPAFAEWFVDGLNTAADDGWFSAFDQQSQAHLRMLTHLVFDPSGQIINYKTRDVGSSFGPALALLLLKTIGEEGETTVLWDDTSDSLRVPLRRGYRKLIRAQLKDSLQVTNKEFNQEVNHRADVKVTEHLREFARLLNVEGP